jgi:hypothetical protein
MTLRPLNQVGVATFLSLRGAAGDEAIQSRQNAGLPRDLRSLAMTLEV